MANIIQVQVARGHLALSGIEWEDLLSLYTRESETGRLIYFLNLKENQPVHAGKFQVERSVVFGLNRRLKALGRPLRIGVQLRVPWEHQQLAVVRIVEE